MADSIALRHKLDEAIPFDLYLKRFIKHASIRDYLRNSFFNRMELMLNQSFQSASKLLCLITIRVQPKLDLNNSSTNNIE
jgi:hypothetical protein